MSRYVNKQNKKNCPPRYFCVFVRFSARGVYSSVITRVRGKQYQKHHTLFFDRIGCLGFPGGDKNHQFWEFVFRREGKGESEGGRRGVGSEGKEEGEG
jgi:hypothetical protein